MAARPGNNFKYCNLCNRPVFNTTKALSCAYCKCLTHISCTRLSVSDLEYLSSLVKFDKDLDPNRNCLNLYRTSNYHTEDSVNSLSCQLKPGKNFSIHY